MQYIEKLFHINELIYTSTSGNATSYLDKGGNAASVYRVDTVANGQVVYSETAKITSNNSYFDIPLNKPASNYTPGDCTVGDADGDGKQEVCMGATCIDHDGKLLWCTGQGHGDAMHLGDFVPDHEGLQVWMPKAKPSRLVRTDSL